MGETPAQKGKKGGEAAANQTKEERLNRAHKAAVTRARNFDDKTSPHYQEAMGEEDERSGPDHRSLAAAGTQRYEPQDGGGDENSQVGVDTKGGKGVQRGSLNQSKVDDFFEG